MKQMFQCPTVFAVAIWLVTTVARADCTLTNTGLTPLNESGFNSYKGVSGGLYPHGANTPPPAHRAAGVEIAQNQIQPLDATGNPDSTNGVIVLLSLGMSNTTQEWASKGTENFRALATNDPSHNPRLRIVDGAFGGQDAVDWTNVNAANWGRVLTQRLNQAGVTTNQVQALWIKQALAGPLNNFGAFPLHAQALQSHLAMIVRNAKVHYPNLKLVYLSGRTRAYTDVPTALNPEPFAFETAFADKWVIEDQILRRNDLNFDPVHGLVVAPWLAWGPYLWADGTAGRSDGFVWLCSDLENDFTHPSATGGVPKVARQLLAFFKTDPTATPWFLRKEVVGQPPVIAPVADVTNGVMPLTVQFSANASDPDGPIRDYQWTFDDGGFSTNANPTKVFPSPGLYHARLTVTDTNGNTAQSSVSVTVNSTLELWQAAKFTAEELADPAVGGDSADPNGDGIPNLLAYAMGMEPKLTNSPALLPSADIEEDYFTLIFTRLKTATDVSLEVEASDDLILWNSGTGVTEIVEIIDLGLREQIKVRGAVPVTQSARKFFRLKAAPLPGPPAAEPLAFPGAEGFGANAKGGRGGQVIYVTNLNDSGPGSLRAAIDTTGPRIIMFKVGGTITLNRQLLVTNPFVTIAGQTAPGGGIALKSDGTTGHYLIEIQTHDVVIRHLRVRPGPSTIPGGSADQGGIKVTGETRRGTEAYNIIVDHVSVSWAEDKAFSVFGNAHHVTLQWSILTEGLFCANHRDTLSGNPQAEEPCPGKNGSSHSRLITISTLPDDDNSPTDISLHHNLLSTTFKRYPNITSDTFVDFVNNVLHNFGTFASQVGTKTVGWVNTMNYVNNYLKPGPITHDQTNPKIFSGGQDVFRVYFSGNTVLAPIIDNSSLYLAPSRFSAPDIVTHSVSAAYDLVLAGAGATLPARDSADARVVNDVENGTGERVNDPFEVGGWPVLASGTPPQDTDGDGMPDDWESAHGLDPHNASDGSLDADGDGYTNVEEYLNSL